MAFFPRFAAVKSLLETVKRNRSRNVRVTQGKIFLVELCKVVRKNIG